MKGRPSLKGRTRFSDAPNSTDVFRSAALEPARAPRRKQIEKLDPAADLQRSEEWDATALDLEGPQPRR